MSTILLVDPPMPLYRSLEPPLTAAGYFVMAAETGTEALAMASLIRINLIIVSMHLPDMPWRWLIHALKTQVSGHRCPSVLLGPPGTAPSMLDYTAFLSRAAPTEALLSLVQQTLSMMKRH